MELDTEQIDKLLSADKTLNFLGVFPLDRIPKKINTRKPVCLIFNSDESDRQGQHWIPLIFTNGICVYIDSLGISPFQPVTSIIRNHSDSCVFNKNLIQNPVGRLCGFYAIYFCKRATVNEPNLGQILKPFSPYYLDKNDKFVARWVNDYAKTL